MQADRHQSESETRHRFDVIRVQGNSVFIHCKSLVELSAIGQLQRLDEQGHAALRIKR